MWHASVENLLSKYCDESQIRENLHRQAYYHFKRTLSWFQLPIIILSAASGSLQFLSKSFPAYESGIVTGTATISISVSIISAIMTYLKLGEQQTKNEVAQIAWQDFYNRISHQLNLARELRDEPTEFLQKIKTDRDRLFEISPICSSKFILKVKKRVLKHATDEFQVPPYMNGFKHTRVWREGNEEDDEEEEIRLDNREQG